MNIFDILKKINDNLLLVPEARFDSLCNDSDYYPSLVYLLTCVLLSMPLWFVVEYFTPSNPLLPVTSRMAAILIGVVLAVPLSYILFGLQHILLRLFGGKATYLQSCQVLIYGGTARFIFGVVPLINLIAGLISLANVVIGAARVHKISLYRAIAALIVVPLIVVALLIVAVGSLLGPSIFM
ncbi:MAG: YIP1 family protein [Candidatus Bilamarchaeum sp.]